MRWILSTLIILLCLCKTARSEDILFFGDLLLSRGIDKYSTDKGISSLEEAIAPFVQKEAIKVVNLEGVTGDSSACAPAHKPCFSIRPELLVSPCAF